MTPEPLTPYGVQLRYYRRRAGLTLQNLSDAINKSVPYLSDMERGYRRPFKHDVSLKIGRMLGLSETEMAGWLDSGICPCCKQVWVRGE